MSTEIQKPQATRTLVHDDGPLAHLMDSARFEHLFRIANTMANSAFTPKHLKGQSKEETVANCFRVVNQSVLLNMDPFAVADHTFVLNGKLGYLGAFIAAVVNTRSGMEGRLRHVYDGSGDDRRIIILGRFSDEDADRTIELTVRQGKTGHKMWTDDPDQKLWYSGAAKWARRHCPEVLLGIRAESDIDDESDDRFVDTIVVDSPRSGNARMAALLAKTEPFGNSEELPDVEENHSADPVKMVGPSEDFLKAVAALGACSMRSTLKEMHKRFRANLTPAETFPFDAEYERIRKGLPEESK